MTRYGCHSDTVGPGPRGRDRQTHAQDGYEYSGSTRYPVIVEVRKSWIPMNCGHIAQAGKGSDPLCAGCENTGF